WRGPPVRSRRAKLARGCFPSRSFLIYSSFSYGEPEIRGLRQAGPRLAAGGDAERRHQGEAPWPPHARLQREGRQGQALRRASQALVLLRGRSAAEVRRR